MSIRLLLARLALLCLGGCAATSSTGAARAAPAVKARPAFPWSAAPEAWSATTAAGQVRHDAKMAEPLVTTPFGRRFLAAASALPEVAARPLFRTRDKERYYSEAEAAALPAAERARLEPFATDDELYYFGRYGSPISYSRALDLLASAGLIPAPGGKLLDIGFGYIGHLRMLSSLGFSVAGIDPDRMMRALYSEPADVGTIAGFDGAPAGTLRLYSGFFAKDVELTRAIGGGHQLILSKNVLKRGYIHPDRPVDPKRQIQLGVDDATYLKTLHDTLAPGGAMLVYNICPAPSPPDKPFVPWSDGRSPWSEAQWRAAGFQVLAFDRDDTAAIRALGHALKWDAGAEGMDLDRDLSVLYTLVQRD